MVQYSFQAKSTRVWPALVLGSAFGFCAVMTGPDRVSAFGLGSLGDIGKALETSGQKPEDADGSKSGDPSTLSKRDGKLSEDAPFDRNADRSPPVLPALKGMAPVKDAAQPPSGSIAKQLQAIKEQVKESGAPQMVAPPANAPVKDVAITLPEDPNPKSGLAPIAMPTPVASAPPPTSVGAPAVTAAAPPPAVSAVVSSAAPASPAVAPAATHVTTQVEAAKLGAMVPPAQASPPVAISGPPPVQKPLAAASTDGDPSLLGGAGVPKVIPAVAAKAPDKAGETPTDFYGDRAKGLLIEEKKASTKLSPFQVAAPDYDVMVCEAGCQNGPGVVSKRLKSAAPSATADKGTTERQLLLKSAECRGGCYDGLPRMSGLGMGQRSQVRPVLGADAGSWMTTVNPEKPTDTAPGSTNKKRENWMSRINRERSPDNLPGALTKGAAVQPEAPQPSLTAPATAAPGTTPDRRS
jgi:hypothetical protein